MKSKYKVSFPPEADYIFFKKSGDYNNKMNWKKFHPEVNLKGQYHASKK